MQKEPSNILVRNIFSSSDIKNEYEHVDELLMFLKESYWLQEGNRKADVDPATYDLESAFLEKAKADDAEASNIPMELLRSENLLKQLVFYIFDRRFGWSELQEDTVEGTNQFQGSIRRVNAPSNSPHHRFRSGSVHFAEESRIKKMLNTKLDELISLFATEEKLSCQLLDAYEFALHEAQNLPVVRSQLFCHILGWLTLIASDETAIGDDIFPSVKSVVVAGVTDIWSAIRNNTASRIVPFLEYLALEHFQNIFLTFTQICYDVSSTWQEKEGAIMAIAGIIQCFKLTIAEKSVLSKDGASKLSGGTVVCRRFGRHYFISLPSFISEPLQRILYKLLSDSQLSIKEHANRAFCSFLLRSEFSQVIDAFKEVLLHLAKGALFGNEKRLGDWKFKDANKADGYIKAAEFLIKHIPTDYILHNWHLCFATISHYLMHPASTVRQAASSVIKYLVAKQASELILPNLVAQHLVAGWKTGIESLKKPSTSLDVSSVSQRSSVKCLEKNGNDNIDITELWEWREGRLLAYELILKFLITNHIHYTFPAYTLTRAVVSKAASVEPRKSIDSEHKFSVSHNFGSRRGKGFSRHDTLSRSLTMESDPLTQKYISSLIDKEKTKNQTHSLLELMKKAEGENSHPTFDDLQTNFCEGVSVYSAVTAESIKKLEDFSEDSLSSSKPPEIELNKVQFGRILIQIFAQTLECMSDARWELRRMAHQVFPLISETIRFYDAKILENLWESNLSSNSSKLSFGACMSLKDSLAHVAKLVKYFENPPGFWKDIERCRLAAKRIVDSINERLPGLLQKTTEILHRKSFDQLTVISMEIIMLSVIHFPQQSHQTSLISSFISKAETLFMQACPLNPYASYLLSSNTQPFEAFESRSDSLLRYAYIMEEVSQLCVEGRDAQDALFATIQFLLPAFFRSSDFEDTVPLLPLVLHQIYSLIDLSTDVQPLFQACHVLLREESNKEQGRSLQLTVSSKLILNFACEDICNVIQKKILEMVFLRQYLELLQVILQKLGNAANLRMVFAAVISKIDLNAVPVSALRGDYEVKGSEHCEDELLRIRMLSNDISQSPIEDMQIDIEDEQEDSPRDLPESQALSKSFDLNCNFEKIDERSSVSPLERADSLVKDDNDSDWDSWEDEEEDSSQIRAVLQAFLCSLQQTIGPIASKDSIFSQELQYCDLQDRKLIQSLMSKEMNV